MARNKSEKEPSVVCPTWRSPGYVSHYGMTAGRYAVTVIEHPDGVAVQVIDIENPDRPINGMINGMNVILDPNGF